MYEQYTDKQIVEMLKPKLTKIMDGMDGMLDTAFEHSESGRNLIKLIATIYRSAYIRGQLGRSFIIGEQKERDFATAFQIEDKVKLITKNDIDESNPCFPPIGTIKKVTEPWFPATKDNVKIGSKVRMINSELHNNYPRWFPIVGTVGIVKKLNSSDCDVQWPKGTTSWQDKWWCNYEHLEVLLCEE